MANSSHESGRIRSLNAKREEEKKHQERQRELIRKDNQVNLGSIDEQFLARTDTVDDVLVRNTVGLVTKEEYVNKKKMIQRMQDESQADAENAAHAQKKRKKAKKKKQSVNKLSFGDDVVDDIQEEAEDGAPPRPPRLPSSCSTHQAAASSGPLSLHSSPPCPPPAPSPCAQTHRRSGWERTRRLTRRTCPTRSVRRCGAPITWTIIQNDGPNHLGLRCNALPGHQMV